MEGGGEGGGAVLVEEGVGHSPEKSAVDAQSSKRFAATFAEILTFAARMAIIFKKRQFVSRSDTIG